MRWINFVLPLLLAVVLVSARAEDKGAANDKKAPTTTAPAGTPTTVEGKLLPPPGGQGVAGLKVEKVTYVLWAEKDVATQLEAMLKKHSNASVNGSLAADGKNLKVTSATEVPAKKDK